MLPILMLCRKIFELLLLVKIKVSNFIGKSLKLAPFTFHVPRHPWIPSILTKAHMSEGSKINEY